MPTPSNRRGQNTKIFIAFLALYSLLVIEAKYEKPICPIGFDVGVTKENSELYCIRLKDSEHFNSKFIDCTDNQFTEKLYSSLNVTKTNTTIWADYKTLYPGGPFIDWSYTSSTGDILTKTFQVKYISETGINENLCTVIEPSGAIAAASCIGKHRRYCIVKPYEEFKDMTSDGCEGLQNYMRFWSPRATCLSYVKGRRGGNVRASWTQASDLCIQKNGTLLQRGWRFANHPKLHASRNPDEWMEPLGLVMTSGEKMRWVNIEDGSNEVSNSEWNFDSGESFEDDTALVAMKGDSWRLVNHSYIFYEVICERSIHLRNVSLDLTHDNEGLRLIVNDSSIDSSKIWCFTDSIIFFPSQVKVTRIEDSNDFSLKPQTDGYFWCVHSDSKNFQVSESNRELYIRDKVAVNNLYAIKVQTREKFTLEHLEKLLNDWSQTLSEYIYVTNQYKRLYKKQPVTRGLNSSIDEMKELCFENKTYNVLLFMKFKRIYLDGKTALLQAQINANMEPVSPGVWDNLTVIFMKPAYYCKSFDGVPTLELGESITINCITYSCVGDFNEGVNWVEVATEGCVITTKPPSTVTSSLVFETTTTEPLLPVEIVAGHHQARSANTRIADPSDDSSEETTPRPSTITPLPPPPPTTTPTPTEFTPETTTYRTTYPTTTETETVTITQQTVTTVETTTESATTVTEVDVFETTTPCRDESTTGSSIVTVFDNDSVQTATSPGSSTRPPPCTRPPCGPSTSTTAQPTQELLQNVMDNLEQLMQDESAPVNLEDVSTSFDTIDVILGDDSEEFEIPGQLLNILERLASRIVLNGTTTATSVRSNIALLLADAGPAAPCRGMKLFNRDDDAFAEDSFEFLSESPNSTQLSSNVSEAVVYLPESVAQSERRISFVVYRNDRAFSVQSTNNVYTVNSRVLSVNVENVSHFQDGEVVDIHFRPISSDTNDTRACAYWHFLEDGSGYWSQEGCIFISSAEPGMLDTCRCNHLTHFAELLIGGTNFTAANETALEIISIVCSIISLFGLLMIGITAALFRSWRKDFSNKIWLQLCVAIFVLLICFMIATFANFEDKTTGCLFLGVVMHYSVIASFCWMLVAALISYRRLVLVFTRDASHKLLRASAFAWGTPCAVVGILLSVDPQSYDGLDNDSVTSRFCYPTGLGLWLAVYLPVALMLIANWTLFVLIVRSVFASRGIQRHGDSKEALRCATVSCLLVFLFGLPWVFGLFAWSITFSYLFTMTATLQGFVLFVFFVLGNKKTRDLWLNKLKIKQSRKVPVTSSTYKSTGGPGWRGASGKNISIEANLSKPRSLALSDDSRFS